MGNQMAKVKQALQERLAALTSSMGFELLGCEMLQMGKHSVFRLYIDSPEGVTSEDCSKIGRQVGALMDAEELMQGKYSLEVSSPGIDRPLFEQKHYEQFVGSTIKLRLFAAIDGRRNMQGVLEKVEGDKIHLKMTDSDQEVVVALSDIDRANVIGEVKF